MSIASVLIPSDKPDGGAAPASGPRYSLLLSTDTANATHREESLLVQEALRRIGIQLDIKYYPQNILYETAAMGGILQGGKYDVSLAPWYEGIDPDDLFGEEDDEKPLPRPKTPGRK